MHAGVLVDQAAEPEKGLHSFPTGNGSLWVKRLTRKIKELDKKGAAMRAEILSNDDHDKLDVALGKLLVSYDKGYATKEDVIATVMHVVASIDSGNLTEVDTFVGHPRGR